MRRAQEGPSSKSLASTSESEYLVVLTFKHRCGLKTGKHGGARDRACVWIKGDFPMTAHTPTLLIGSCVRCVGEWGSSRGENERDCLMKPPPVLGDFSQRAASQVSPDTEMHKLVRGSSLITHARHCLTAISALLEWEDTQSNYAAAFPQLCSRFEQEKNYK